MSEFSEIERREIAVQCVRVGDGLAEIGRAWSELESVVSPRGRRFYGAYDALSEDYRACVQLRPGDPVAPNLESGTLPGGRYLRARLRGEPPGIYEQIKATFDALVAEQPPDLGRPFLEYYRRHDEIELLLPI